MVGLRNRSRFEGTRAVRWETAPPGLAASVLGTARRGLSLLLLLSLCVTSAGCFTFAVRTKDAKATPYHSRTVYAYLWNVVETEPVVVAEECGNHALSAVRARTNILAMAVGVGTLGAFVPMGVEWRCAEK